MRTFVVQLSFLLSLLGGLPAAWSAAPAESIIVAASGITYTTRAGDTLTSIAQQFTAKAENWIVLGRVNNIAKDTNIPIGTAIAIPSDLLMDEPSEARVIALSGSITVAPNGKAPVLLALGAKITEGMQIETGNNSFLTLSLPDQSRISVPSNSRIKIAKLRLARYTKSPRTEITLLRGRVESHVSPLEQSKGHFEIRSPLAVAGVRGTHFRVSVGENGTITEVLSGNVAVAQIGQPSPLTLHAGQGDVIDAKSVGKPIDLLPTPQLAESPARLDRAAAQFTLTPIAGASSYHVQIASDQEAQDILTEGRSAGTRMKIDGVPSGDYFARVSAIDRFGLEGPASTHAFTLGSATTASSNGKPGPSAPAVDRNDNKQLSLRWSAAPGQKFTVQVARDQAFTWLLYTSDTATPEVHLPRPAFGTYYARVRAVNADGSVSAYSLAQPFVVTDQWIIHDGNPVSAQENSSGPIR